MAESLKRNKSQAIHVIVGPGTSWSQQVANVSVPGMGSVRVVRGDVIDRANRAANSEIRATIDRRSLVDSTSDRE